MATIPSVSAAAKPPGMANETTSAPAPLKRVRRSIANWVMIASFGQRSQRSNAAARFLPRRPSGRRGRREVGGSRAFRRPAPPPHPPIASAMGPSLSPRQAGGEGQRADDKGGYWLKTCACPSAFAGVTITGPVHSRRLRRAADGAQDRHVRPAAAFETARRRLTSRHPKRQTSPCQAVKRGRPRSIDN